MVRHDLAAAAEFAANSARVFTVDGRRIAVFLVEGTFYALDDRCSHATASLAEGDIDSDELCVECPRHGARFDLRSGKALSAPAYSPVQRYPVVVEDQRVILELL